MNLKNNKLKILIILISVIIGFTLFFTWQNNDIVISKFNYYNSKIPKDFNNFKIAHISDLHNKSFGNNQKFLLNKLKRISPDIIVITGDLIDSKKYNLDTSMIFIAGATKIAPVYYVSGNHEAWSGKFDIIIEKLKNYGVNILNDTEINIKNGESSISLLGLNDPALLGYNYLDGLNLTNMISNLNQWSSKNNFKILLSHRPELFDLYLENNMDLVFTGHAHGGQIRIPGIGGLIAPDQGLFPMYTSGSYTKDLTTMFVSRGLGNSIFPLRIFNRPEIISVTLKSI